MGLKTFCTDPPLQPTAGRVSQTNRLDNRFLQHAHQAEREIVFVFVHYCIFIFAHSKCAQVSDPDRWENPPTPIKL